MHHHTDNNMNTENQESIDANNEMIAFLTAENVKLAENKPVHHLLTTVEDGRFVASADGAPVPTARLTPSCKISCHAQGRLFATEQECINSIDKEAAKVRINRAILLANGDWVQDWMDRNEHKYSPFYNYKDRLRGASCWTIHQHGFTFIACHSRKALEKIISDHAADFALVVGGE